MWIQAATTTEAAAPTKAHAPTRKNNHSYPLKVFILCVIYPSVCACIFFLRSSFIRRLQFRLALHIFRSCAYCSLVYLHRIRRSVFCTILYHRVSIFGIALSSSLLNKCACALSYLGGFVWSLFEGFTPHFFQYVELALHVFIQIFFSSLSLSLSCSFFLSFILSFGCSFSCKTKRNERKKNVNRLYIFCVS